MPRRPSLESMGRKRVRLVDQGDDLVTAMKDKAPQMTEDTKYSADRK